MSGIFALPGFSLSYVSADLMHCSDLGTLLVLCGNVAWELFVAMGGNMAHSSEQCKDLLCMMKVAAKHLNIEPPVNTLCLSMSKARGKAPKFKLKAAESRRMLYVLHFVLLHVFPHESGHDKLRLQCVAYIAKMYREMEAWGPDSGTTVAELARRHLLLYHELSLDASSAMFWRLYPKHHLFLHFMEDQVALAGNPREHWTYADESCIGLIAKLAASCHAGTVHRVVISRYRASRY
jgi:hypothetical protein